MSRPLCCGRFLARLFLIGACLLPPASALALPDGQPQPSAALECLTPRLAERPQPTYPPQRLERKEGARFELELRFDSPRRGPRMRVLPSADAQDEPDRDFVDAAREWASALRVPCMAEDAGPVLLRQRFEFEPLPMAAGRSSAGMPEDEQAERHARTVACLRHAEGHRRPSYPMLYAESGRQGNVLARLTIRSANAAPEVEILTEPPRARFGDIVREWAQGLRAGCFDGDEPVRVGYTFRFLLENEDRVVIPDLDLRRLVGGLDTYPSPIQVDTREMGCPFELRMTYHAPFMNNDVEEIGVSVPARAPLLQWLRKVSLRVSPSQSNRVLGDSFLLSVPCTRLDIQPR
jgi:hypothetical protein